MPSEASEQVKVFLWLNSVRDSLPGADHAFHPPNGGLRNGVVAGQMVAMGVKRGVPDIVLPYRVGDWVGLVAEMKSDSGSVSKDQAKWFERFKAQGWKTAVWRSADEAIEGLKEYLG